MSQGGPYITTHASTRLETYVTGKRPRQSAGICFRDDQISPVSVHTRSSHSSQVSPGPDLDLWGHLGRLSCGARIYYVNLQEYAGQGSGMY